jgi:cell division septation protein DedD
MSPLVTGAAFGRRRGWTDRALAVFRPDDDRFTDLEILIVLDAGESGLNLADVCAAADISEVTYYAWMAKYNGLAPSDVRNRRRRDRRKHRATMAVAAMAALSIGAVSVLIGMANASQSEQVSARPAAAAATVAIPVRAPDLPTAAAAEPALKSPADDPPPPRPDAAQPVGLPVSAPPVHTQDIKTADPDGYPIQVAAVPDLWEARAILEQLSEAGYPAYLIAKTVDHVTLYRVRVGPLKSRAEAENVVRRLEHEGHPAPWITR